MAAEWIRHLIKAGHVAPGVVDERDIQDVLPSDVEEFVQCHFFAGVAAWSYALRRAGWPDDRPVWTGSCPCQPFSSAGKGSAFADERHLWPAWQHLIAQRKPATVFGEQVASKAVDDWIDLVHADMEGLGYAFGSVPFPSASVGAPHIRDRLYWVAYATSDRWSRQGAGWAAEEGRQPRSERTGQLSDGLEGHGASVGVADSSGARLDQRQRVAGIPGRKTGADERQAAVGNGVCSVVGLADMHGNGFWRDADWLRCRDGKWRPVEPGAFPLVARTPPGVVRGGSDGFPIDSDKTGEARVMRLRGYGNSINAVQAQAFIEAFMDYQQQVSA